MSSSSSNSTSSSNPRTILKPVRGRAPQINDLVEINYNGHIFNTRIVDIQGSTLYVLHKKTNTIVSLTWNGTGWRLINGLLLSDIKFFESSIPQKIEQDDRFQFRNLEKEAQIQVLLNANQETFMTMCSLPELKNICVGTQDAARLYFERLKIDLDNDVYNLVLNSGEIEPNLTWKEIYDRVHRLNQILALNENKKHYINDLLLNKRMLELYLLSKLKTPVYPDYHTRGFNKMKVVEENVIEFFKNVNLGMAYEGKVEKDITRYDLSLVVQTDEVLIPTNKRLQEVLPFLSDGPLRGFIGHSDLVKLFYIYIGINSSFPQKGTFRITSEFRHTFSHRYPAQLQQDAEESILNNISRIITNSTRILNDEETAIFNLPISRYELLQQSAYIIKSNAIRAPLTRRDNRIAEELDDVDHLNDNE